MVHTAVAYAKMKQPAADASPAPRRSGRARPTWSPARRLATINRLPVLLLPGDIFARRNVAPVLQQLESERTPGYLGQRLLQAGQPLLGPHQPPRAAPDGAARGDARADQPGRDRRGDAGAAAGRADRGVRLPGGALRASASGTIPRNRPDRAALERAAAWIRASQRPLIVAGGGVHLQRGDRARCAASSSATGIPVGETMAGKGSLPYDHPLSLGAIGVTGTLARQPRRARRRPGDRHRHALQRLHDRLEDRLPEPRRALHQHQRRRASTPPSTARCRWSATRARRSRSWPTLLDGLPASTPTTAPSARRAARRVGGRGRPDLRHPPRAAAEPGRADRRGQRARRPGRRSWSARPAACPATCTSCGARATRSSTTWSTATLHGLRDRRRPGRQDGRAGARGLRDGRRRLLPDDGAARSSPSIQEGYKLTIVLLDNDGFKSIGGAQPLARAGRLRHALRLPASSGALPGDDAGGAARTLPVDLAANAAQPGRARDRVRRLRRGRGRAGGGESGRPHDVIYVRNDRLASVPGYDSWWDVPVAEVSEMPSVQAARREWEAMRAKERSFL